MLYNSSMSKESKALNNIFGKRLRCRIALIIARVRLLKIGFTGETLKRLTDILAISLYRYGIFKVTRIKNFKTMYCAKCEHKRESDYGDWCLVQDKFLKDIKDAYCGGYTEKEE